GYGDRDRYGGYGDRDRYGYDYDRLDYIDEPIEIFRGQSISFTYKDSSGKLKTSVPLAPNSTTTICAQLGSVVTPPGLKATQIGPCGGTPPPPPPPPPPPRGGGGSGGGTSGGGGRGFGDVLFDDQDDYINPFDNRGDRVDRVLRQENFR
ncbi:hypothetical protein EB155_03205, partial [archaeon]|nr:hypothetical protein [archaeon]